MEEARDHNYLLVKGAGSGQQDMQCCSVNDLMPAAWADDPGLYVVAAIIAVFTDTTLSETQSWFYWLFKSLYLMGCIFVAWFAARQFKLRFSSVLCALMVSICGAVLFLNYLPFVNYGVGRGDFFYGFLSVVMFATIGLTLLMTSVLQNSDHGPRTWVVITTVCLITAVAELFRSGALLLLPLIFTTFCFSVRTRLLIWYMFCVFAGSWLLGRILAVSISIVRWAQTGIPIDIGISGHGIWHTLYLGLSFTIDGANNSFGILWSDNFLYELITAGDPTVELYSTEYQDMARHLYWNQVAAEPVRIIVLYFAKTLAAVFLVWPEIVCLTIITLILQYQRKLGLKWLHFTCGVAASGASLSSLVVAMPQTEYLIFATPWLQILIVLSICVALPVPSPATEAAHSIGGKSANRLRWGPQVR